MLNLIQYKNYFLIKGLSESHFIPMQDFVNARINISLTGILMNYLEIIIRKGENDYKYSLSNCGQHDYDQLIWFLGDFYNNLVEEGDKESSSRVFSEIASSYSENESLSTPESSSEGELEPAIAHF